MLTPLELDIMKAVWNAPSASVRDVQLAIRPARKLAYTTVMTLMNRLFQKGFLTRTLKLRKHLYDAAVPFSVVRKAAVEGLIDDFFDGSRDHLREFLTGKGMVPVPEPLPSHPAALDETLL